MKLSDAMMLGPAVAELNDGHCTLNECKGCAMGVALRAMGYAGRGASELTVKEYWPWVNSDVWSDISRQYFRVVAGEITFESLVDYVRSIEPNEPEPQQEAVPELAAVAQPR